VILACADADQMGDWKMKGVTDDEGRREIMERGKQNKRDCLVDRFVPFMTKNVHQLICKLHKNSCNTNTWH